ncbi:glycosyltransferase [Sedimentitalea sp. JM2-8]|uniref:Glycosyltransferase n=2 Tax=Sedimentitalea xiamensis TaxID=3050037 RepID=A0ABT7FI75_9RHOB|nr:glycosyltransferase [Sedimentitalea xiamensis]
MDMKTNTIESRLAAAVIIPHYNDVTRLGRCLEELTRNDLADVDVLIVDNGSTVPLNGIQARFPDFRFVTEPEKGAAAARNRGIAETAAPLLLFIDADCVPDQDWVSVAREIAPKADLTGGRVSVFDETPPPRSGAEAFEAVFAFDFKTYVEKGGFSGAGNLVTRRDVFDAIGGFTNGVSEDREWTMRAVARGYSLAYEDRLRVSHPSRQDWPALRQKWRRMTNEMYQLNGTDFRARARWIAKALAMPISAVVHVPKVLRSGRLNGPGEHLRAIGTLFRIRLLRMVWMLKQAAGLSI